jgi:hypothetical protein
MRARKTRKSLEGLGQQRSSEPGVSEGRLGGFKRMYLSGQCFLLFGQFLVSDFAIVGCHWSRRRSVEARRSTLEIGGGLETPAGSQRVKTRCVIAFAA